jgi:hypothetical protein
MSGDFGTSFASLPRLSRVRDLEAFEGPILTELRAPNNALYLQKWCAYHDGAVRTLVVRSDQRSVAEYLAGRMTMLHLLTRPNDDVGFLVDRARSETKSVRLVQVTTLPAKYLPKPSAMHDESLRPEWDTIPQSFLVDTNWDAKLLSDLEKHYLTVYAFNFFTDVQSDKLPPEALHTYVLDGGYAYHALFRTLRQSVPKNDNARSIGVAAASPGVLTIAVPATTANQITRALASAAQERTKKAYDVLHDWSRLPPRSAASVPVTAQNDIRRLCEHIHVAADKILPAVEESAQILRAGKVVAAYYRALWRLIEPTWEGVEFLAPAVVREVEAPAEDHDDDYYDDDEEEEEDEDTDTQ